MHFQLRTDNHISNSERLAESVRADITPIADRLGERLRRVEVYLEDVNAGKGGIDIRCTIEVHLAGMPAASGEHRAGEVSEAVEGAVEKVLRVVEHKLGRIDDRAGRTPAAGEVG